MVTKFFTSLQTNPCTYQCPSYVRCAAIGVRTHLLHLGHSNASRGVYADIHSAHSHLNMYQRLAGMNAVSAGEVLTGQELVLSNYDEELFEPSHDLHELASAQLQLMFQMLARICPEDARSWRACVYARRADSLESPQIRLQRVGCWPSRIHQPSVHWGSAPPAAAGSSADSSTSAVSGGLDDMLTLHRPAWEGGSSSSTCDAEASLVQEEMVVLPNSNLLVLPLAEAGVLVGLLVVEVVGEASEDALWCLRTAVPPLTKACAMDLRVALAGGQQEAQKRLARSLLTEARAPLKVLGTFGAMLAPRLRAHFDSQPESDMADGMVMQGQRLADVVAQLEAALRPSSSSAPAPAAAAVPAIRRAAWQQQLALPAVDGVWVADAAVDEYDDVPAAGTSSQQQQLLQEQQQQQHQVVLQQQQLPAAAQPAGDIPAVSPSAGLLPQSCCSSMDDSTILSDIHSQQQQQVVPEAPQLPSYWAKPAGPLQASSRDIRWSGVQVGQAPTHTLAASSGVPCNSSDSATATTTCSAHYSTAASVSGLDVQKTIDMEPTPICPASEAQALSAVSVPQGSDSNAMVGPVAPAIIITTGSRTSSKKPLRQRQQQQPSLTAAQRSLCCNLVEALSHLLTAASRLAQVQGINFIVNHPLQLDQPTSQHTNSSSKNTSSTSDQERAAAGSRSNDGTSSAVDLVTLLPRPVRPLLVGLSAGTCRRVLGFVLDVALQCTPRGGQLSVTARQCVGGVEVNVLHTGHAQPSRLHTTSKALNPKLYSQLSNDLTGGGSGSSSSSNVSVQRLKVSHASGSRPTSLAAQGHRPSQSAARSAGGGLQDLASSSGLQGSSSLVSLDFAGQALRALGGRLSVVYPCHFMNAISGQLEVGSSIELWLPPPTAIAQ